jgi:hypothetical protein
LQRFGRGIAHFAPHRASFSSSRDWSKSEAMRALTAVKHSSSEKKQQTQAQNTVNTAADSRSGSTVVVVVLLASTSVLVLLVTATQALEVEAAADPQQKYYWFCVLNVQLLWAPSSSFSWSSYRSQAYIRSIKIKCKLSPPSNRAASLFNSICCGIPMVPAACSCNLPYRYFIRMHPTWVPTHPQCPAVALRSAAHPFAGGFCCSTAC